MDLYPGIDRVFYTSEGTIVTVQKRFRRPTYAAYQDVTFCYRRNHHDAKRYSEFYKIQADYLLYGIIAGRSKNTAPLASFRKVVLLQLAPLWEKLRTGKAVIDEAKTGKCYWPHQKLIVPVNHNRDSSSSFIAWDIPLIARYWPTRLLCASTDLSHKKTGQVAGLGLSIERRLGT